MQRDTMIDVLKGLGITTVVIGHIEGFWFTIVPVYSFHMPLFFFISGLFFSERARRDSLSALGGLARNLILPTLAVVLFYAAVQDILNHFGVLQDDITIAGVFAFGTKLLDTYWYIGCYFCIYLYFHLVHRRLVDLVRERTRCRPESITCVSLGCYFLLAALCMYVSAGIYSGYAVNDKWEAVAEHESLILLIRVGFGAFFYYLGSCFALLRGRYKLSWPWLCMVLLICLGVCRLCWYLTDGKPDFSMQIMYFRNPIMPFVTSVFGIGMLYAAAALSAKLRPVADVFALLGRRSFSIMSHHIFAFFLLNLLFLALGLVDKARLGDPYFKWRQEYTHPLYLFVGLAYPLFFSWLIRRLSGRLGETLRAQSREGSPL